MIGYFKNRDRVTLLNQSFWHTRQRSFRRGEICQLIHRPRLGCRPRGLHFSWTQGTGTRGGIIPGRALATTLLGDQSEISLGSFLWRSTRESSPPAGISKSSCVVLLEGSNKASLRHFQQPRIALPPIRGFRPRDCALDDFASIGKRNGKLPDQFVFARLTRTDLVAG